VAKVVAGGDVVVACGVADDEVLIGLEPTDDNDEDVVRSGAVDDVDAASRVVDAASDEVAGYVVEDNNAVIVVVGNDDAM